MGVESFKITKRNVIDFPWVKDFFDGRHLKGESYWDAGTTFTYKNYSFKLSLPVVARARKRSGRGYAYEMIDINTCLGNGAYGYVYKIAKTISLSKTGTVQARDKNRVVKQQAHSDAKAEYERAWYATHLHIKPPVDGYMVMRKMAGMSLRSFLNNDYENPRLNRKDKLALTKALVYALRDQVANKHMRHRDLHSGNILVDMTSDSKQSSFTVNIIDFGLAYYQPKFNSTQINWDYFSLAYSIRRLWENDQGVLNVINKTMLRGNNSLDWVVEQIDSIIVAPNSLEQYSLDLYLTYLTELAEKDKALADKLRESMRDAVDQSHDKYLQPMREAIIAAKEIINASEVDLPFPCILFDSNPQKQALYNQIMRHLTQLKNKSDALITLGEKESGEQLLKLCERLSENTFTAIYDSSDKTVLNECVAFCQEQLKENQDILDTHRNYNYIYAEIGIILSCLVVLYPIVAGFHYLATGRFTFFGQTQTSVAAESLQDSYKQLIAVN